MANALYEKYKNRVLGLGSQSLADWDTNTIKGVLCTATYTPNLSTDEFLDDVPSGAQIVAATITGVSISAGAVLVSGSITFTPGSSGDVLTQLVIYKDTGSGATSPLLVLFDSFSGGIPVTTVSGTPITLTFNASGIFTT